jgi:hypothetical protein
MDSLLAPTRATRYQHFEKDGPGPRWKSVFFVKNDLKAREDIKEIIQRPIWFRFGLRRPKVEIDDAVEA